MGDYKYFTHACRSCVYLHLVGTCPYRNARRMNPLAPPALHGQANHVMPRRSHTAARLSRITKYFPIFIIFILFFFFHSYNLPTSLSALYIPAKHRRGHRARRLLHMCFCAQASEHPFPLHKFFFSAGCRVACRRFRATEWQQEMAELSPLVVR